MTHYSEQPRQAEMLMRIAHLLVTLDLDEVLLEIIKITTETVGAARGSFFLMDEQGRSLDRFIAARDLDPEKKPAVSGLVLGSGLAGWVISHRTAAIVEDTFTDPRWIMLEDDAEFSRVRSALCVPFFVEDQIRGVMTLEHPETQHFTQDDLRLIEAVAHQTSAALQNAQLFDRIATQQRQMEAVLNNINDALFVFNAEWKLRLANPAAYTLVGRESGSLLDKTPHEILELTSSPLLSQILEQVRVMPATYSQHRFEIHDDRSARDLAVSVTALQGATPIDNGFVVALHDVTTLKDLSRLKTHMIQMASHDLKNPIGVVRGYLDVVRSDASNGRLPEPMFLDNMYKALSRMETLVANLLEIQRAEQQSPLKRETIDPYELLHAVFDDMILAASQRQQAMIQDVQQNMGKLKGDFVRLREAMNNLIENAIKYTPPGGKITITAYMEDDRFSFMVKDNGYGISGDQQSKLFQPYFRAVHTGVQDIGGTGLGLSLVKEVIERHGGQVWFSSIENHGSTFGFWLPLLG